MFNKKKYRGLLAATSSTRGSNPLSRYSQGRHPGKDDKIDVKLKPALKLKRAVGKLITIQQVKRIGEGAHRTNVGIARNNLDSPGTRAATLEERGGDNVSDLTASGKKAQAQGGSGLFRPPELLKAFGGWTSSRDLGRSRTLEKPRSAPIEGAAAATATETQGGRQRAEPSSV